MTSTGPEVKYHTSNKRSLYFVVKPSMREKVAFYWKLHSPKIEPLFSDNWVCPLIGNLRYQEVCTKNVNLGQLLKCKEDRTVYHVIQHRRYIQSLQQIVNNKVLSKIKIAIKSGIYITHFPLNIRSVATKQN